MSFELIPKGETRRSSRVVRPGSRVRVTFALGGRYDAEIAYIMDPTAHVLDELDLDVVAGIGYTLTPRGAPLNGRYSIWPYPEAAAGPVVARVGNRDIPLGRDVFDVVEVLPEPTPSSPLSRTVDRMLSASSDAVLRAMALRFNLGTPERAKVDGEIARRAKAS